MLFLSRKVGESIMINDDIEVCVLELKGNTVRLGFNSPSTMRILRREVYDRVQNENKLAAQSAITIHTSLLNRQK